MERLKRKLHGSKELKNAHPDHDSPPAPKQTLTGFLDKLNHSNAERTPRRRSTVSSGPAHSPSSDAGSPPGKTKKERRRSALIRHVPASDSENESHGLNAESDESLAKVSPKSPKLDLSPVDPQLDWTTSGMSLGGDPHLMTEPSRGRFSEDVADRNISTANPRPPLLPIADSMSDVNLPQARPSDLTSSTAASSTPSSKKFSDPPRPPDKGQVEPTLTTTPKRLSATSKATSGPSSCSSTSSSSRPDSEMKYSMSSEEARRRKPIGSVHSPAFSHLVAAQARPSPGCKMPCEYNPPRENSKAALDSESELISEKLSRVLDLSNTEDATFHHRYAPAVQHEVVKPEAHHIREEKITREVHTHDIFHRILPIIDVQVLPPKHFIPTRTASGQDILTKIPDSALRHHTGENANWVIMEKVSKISRTHVAHENSQTTSDRGNELEPECPGPRRFTARRFNDNDDLKTYVTPDGTLRTEQTWVHPPTVEDGARLTGQTEPLYMGKDKDISKAGANTRESPNYERAMHRVGSGVGGFETRSLCSTSSSACSSPCDEPECQSAADAEIGDAQKLLRQATIGSRDPDSVKRRAAQRGRGSFGDGPRVREGRSGRDAGTSRGFAGDDASGRGVRREGTYVPGEWVDGACDDRNR